MAHSAKFRRRSRGIFFLTAAGVLLIAGLTLLDPYLKGLGFVVYWLVCFLCTGLAMLTALSDLRAIRDEAKDEQRGLMEETLTEIDQDEDQPRPRRKSTPPSGNRD